MHMTESQAVIKPDEKGVEFTPFGSQDKVKLSIVMVKNLIAVKTKSGKTCTDQDAIKFIAMCQARRLNPFEGDAFLIGYDGKEGPSFSLITAHQAFLKRAELNPEYDGMKSGIIIKNEDGEIKDLEGDFYLDGQEVLGGWATVVFKNRKQPTHKRIRLKRFQKSWGIWQDDPAGMICKCAEADALRSSFPTMLGGLYLREEMKMESDTKVTSPIFTPPPSETAPEPQATAPTLIVEVPAASAPVKETKEPRKKASPQASESDLTIKSIRVQMEERKITEDELMAFLNNIGFVTDTMKKLEQLPQETLDMIHRSAQDMFDKVKGV